MPYHGCPDAGKSESRNHSCHMTPLHHPIYLLPGWQNSGPEHWQSHWEREFGFKRIEQSDWDWPRRGDWMARLDEVLLQDPRLSGPNAAKAVLVAHSLGCQLVASWAEHSQHTHRVGAALLVAPPDTERDSAPPQLHNWRPIRRRRLPFASLAVISSDDPYCEAARGAQMAADWGSQVVMPGALGHINSASNLGAWLEGLDLLKALQAAASR